MSRACIFIGPSLAFDAARQRCPQALWLPPAEQGSLIAAIERHDPQIIAIIDGYFRHRAAVRHKEILWALNRGIQVIGGASMGALRAAELEAYGMQGVGEIFTAYRAGALPPFTGITDDDEVAVVHGPAETGYLAASDAMVNIRWTLQAALHAQVIDPDLHDRLLAIAKAMPFARRRYPAILALAGSTGRTEALQQLERWLVAGRIDQKAIDARAVADAVAMRLNATAKPHRPAFELAEPELWHETLARGVDPRLAEPMPESPASHAGEHGCFQVTCPTLETEAKVLARLAEDAAAWQRVRAEALVFWLLDVQHGWRVDTGIHATPERGDLLRQLDAWRQRHGLFDREAIDHWLAENELPMHRIDTLMAAEARRDALLPTTDDPVIRRLMIERLKLCGDYARLARSSSS